MNDTLSSRGFTKGPRRASFSGSAGGSIEPSTPTDATGLSSNTAVAQPAVGTPPQGSSQPVSMPSSVPVSAPVRPPKTPSKKRNPLKIFGVSVVVALIVTVGGVSFKMYWDSQQKLAKLQSANPEVFSEFEADALVAKVARHMVLPNEKPLVNTVSEVEKLRGESFFANAQNGDKVLVFSQRAILYSPIQDRIIEIGFIRKNTPVPFAEGPSISSPSADASSSGEPSVAGAAAHQPKVLIDTENK